MAFLITTKGPHAGQRYPLEGDATSIGREPDSAVYLESLAVSRRHARILCQGGDYFVEDVGSSNGTFLNGQRVTGRTALTERDSLQIGPYTLALRPDRAALLTTTEPIIRARVEAVASNQTLYAQNPTYKLQVVLEIAQHLGHTLELDPLLALLLDSLLRLFPQADRGMVLLCDRDRFVVRAQRGRNPSDPVDYAYSRTIVRRALDEGAGLLSEDVGDDPNLVLTATLVSLNLRSFLCVPLIGREGRRLGVIQLDCVRKGQMFHSEDLELLTAVGLHVAVVLENASLHAERIKEARLRQELLLAREIQQAFLPTDFAPLGAADPELFAWVNPAREVSGDLYDFFALPGGRLAFFVGDVAGKGMPAALFMIAVRSLSRHLAPAARGPSELLHKLNAALVADNPTSLFVTLAHGVYDPTDGSVVLASGGHPPPLLRRAGGKVEPVAVRPGPILGNSLLKTSQTETRLTLAPGETLILYTDGYTEAFAPDGKTMFGVDKLCAHLGGPRAGLSLQVCAEEVSAAVQRFTGQTELQDDQTLFLLRRPAELTGS
jgi:serine phosphatase RsbU (regulator of sigma subunit)/pSer/pThr/pTyr-binding forkhead associated (FHA) protein